jgi:uncharacterized protein YecE (DUF72 family)
MGDIRVGASSWADRRLLGSGWYPREANTTAGRLTYYAEHFDLVEVDTTYYAIPAVETTTAWVQRTPASFTFDVTAFGLFTGHPTPVSALPADLRPTHGPNRVRRTDLDPATWDRLWERFHEAITPIAAVGKLGVVLLRFPSWFARGDAARRRVLATARECAPFTVAVDLRHRSWFEDGNALDTMLFLQRHGISYCCVDMPPGHQGWQPPVLAAPADPAIVRFERHAPDRMRPDPERPDRDRPDRFRHTYTDGQVRWWIARLRQLAEDVSEVHVLLDNCCGDQAPRDAARLAALLTDVPAGRVSAHGGGASARSGGASARSGAGHEVNPPRPVSPAGGGRSAGGFR